MRAPLWSTGAASEMSVSLFIVAALLRIVFTVPTAPTAPHRSSQTTTSSSSSSTSSRIKKENTPSTNTSVLFILADDLGYANVGWHEPFVLTPHLNRLVEQGITLESYYVQPICSPSRSSLMTGRYTYRLGTQAEIIESYVPFGIPLHERFMAEYFQAAGFATAIFGKCKTATVAQQ